MKYSWTFLAAVCALVIGVYAYAARSGGMESSTPQAADAYYNLLVQGLRTGQLSLKKDVPSGLARLTDPYDPAANAPYRSAPYGLHDLSYYRGRLYLYFGITPALLLFWPFAALTGQYLFHRQAVAIFCTIGFLASVGLLRALWRRYFAGVSAWVVAACALALGLATGVPLFLSGCEVYQVAISCGYMLAMLALGAIWCALHEPQRRWRWLAAASVAYGLAIGARPSLLFGAVVLLVPVIQVWRERQPGSLPRSTWLSALMAATGPIMLIGLGLMLYNAVRFDSPFVFGMRYQLAAHRQVAHRLFNLRYLWFNFRVYFIEPAHWSTSFPFVHEIAVPPVPPGHDGSEEVFGILTNIPLVWLALAMPLAWRNRSGQEATMLRWFLTAVALFFGICALSLCLFRGAVMRYEIEFLPALLLLAVVGILGLDRALADQPAWRRAVRWGWGLLLGCSVAFNLLAAIDHYAKMQNGFGVDLAERGGTQEAIGHFEEALRIEPSYAEAHCNLGVALEQAGRVQEAIEHWKQALRLKPDDAVAHNNLGGALNRVGEIKDAIEHYEQALRIKPEFAEAHYNLGAALEQTGNVREAVEHYQQALRIKPDLTDARSALARLAARQ